MKRKGAKAQRRKEHEKPRFASWRQVPLCSFRPDGTGEVREKDVETFIGRVV